MLLCNVTYGYIYNSIIKEKEKYEDDQIVWDTVDKCQYPVKSLYVDRPPPLLTIHAHHFDSIQCFVYIQYVVYISIQWYHQWTHYVLS